MAKPVGLLVAGMVLTIVIAVQLRRRVELPQANDGASGEFGSVPGPTLPMAAENLSECKRATNPLPGEAAEERCSVDLHVMDEDGAHVVNARLTVFPHSSSIVDGDKIERSGIPLACGVSGNLGEFKFELYPDDYKASASRAGSGPVECGSFEFTISPGERSRNLVLRVPYRWIDGEALDALGTPLPGAHILLHQPDIGGKYPEATASGPDGKFTMWCSTEFPALLKLNGKFDGRASGDAALPWTSEGISDVLELPAGARHAVLRAKSLDAGGRTTFMVADDSGLARPWVEVFFRGDPPRCLRTGDDGCVTMDRVPRGEFVVGARFPHDDGRADVWVLPERIAAVGDGRTVLIRAQRGVPARGKVVGPEGQPLFGADIRRVGDGEYPRVRTTTREDGTFTLLFPPDVKEVIQFQVTYEPPATGSEPAPHHAWIGCVVGIAPGDTPVEIVLSPEEEAVADRTDR
ncbi:MAG: hypothetical protein AAB074_16770 [Planctomycetota bacterium]